MRERKKERYFSNLLLFSITRIGRGGTPSPPTPHTRQQPLIVAWKTPTIEEPPNKRIFYQLKGIQISKSAGGKELLGKRPPYLQKARDMVPRRWGGERPQIAPFLGRTRWLRQRQCMLHILAYPYVVQINESSRLAGLQRKVPLGAGKLTRV